MKAGDRLSTKDNPKNTQSVEGLIDLGSDLSPTTCSNNKIFGLDVKIVLHSESCRIDEGFFRARVTLDAGIIRHPA